jgi:hypothetical protein
MLTSDQFISEALTNVSIAYATDKSEYVASRIYPVVPVKKQAAKYYEWPRSLWAKSMAQKRNRASESAGISWRLESKDAYYCEVYALHSDIDDRDRANVDNQFQVDAEATGVLQNQLLLKRELDFLAKNFVTGKWSTDVAPNVKWDAANATIISDIRDTIAAVRMKSGFRPNKLVVQERVFNRLLESADVIDRLKGNNNAQNPAVANAQTIAAILGLKEVIVAGAITNTATSDLTPNYNFAAGNHALLLYTPDRPGLMTPSAGYTFVWTGLFGVGPEGERVKKFRMENLSSDRIECEQNYDFKIVAPDAGALIHDVLTV